ncbi:MAG: hypothetical protein CBD18_00100 [Opitutales bacterium TMED158]|nr:MAG: hypothetical protein CBD18_00100 [Opitutales bacterium TMED158]
MSDPKKEFDWFDRPGSRKLLWILLWAVCGLSVIAEPFVHRHPHVEELDWGFGYYMAMGFIGCAAMILLAKGMGFFLKRGEDYYDDNHEDNIISDDIDGNVR